MSGSDRLKSALFKLCPHCDRRLPPIPGCTAGLIAVVAEALDRNDLPRALDLLMLETDWSHELASGYLACPHSVPASPLLCDVLKEANKIPQDDLDLEKVFKYWVALDKERFAPVPGESLVERLAQHPWDSKDARVRAAWNNLTQSGNLKGLEKWASLDVLNPATRVIAETALRACKARTNPT